MSLLWALLAVVSGAEPGVPAERVAWTAEQWIAEADENATEVTSIRFAVQRTTERAGNTVKERWRHSMLSPTRFRIDYFGDTSRQVACDGRVLLDYLPALRKAVQLDLATMAPPDVEASLRSVLEKVAVPGLRFGRAEGVRWAAPTTQDQGGKTVVVLTAEGEGGSGLRYTLDPVEALPMRSELISAGKVTVRTDVSDYQALGPGVWFPRKVVVWAPEAGGEVTVSYAISGVTLLPPGDPEPITLRLDPSIPVTAGP